MNKQEISGVHLAQKKAPWFPFAVLLPAASKMRDIKCWRRVHKVVKGLSMVAQHRCKWESHRHVHFLFSKCKSYLCNNSMPKPIAAPPNECLLLCLPLCLHCQHTGILSFTPSPLCFLSLSNQPQRGHTTVLTIIGSFVPDLKWTLAQFSLTCRSGNQAHLGCCQLELDFQVFFTWRLWSNHLLSSASKVNKLEISEALGNTFNLERQLHFSSTSCLTLTRAKEVLLSRGRPYSLVSFTPEKRLHQICAASSFYCWKRLQLFLPPLATLTLSHSSAHPGTWSVFREAKVNYDMNLSLFHLQRSP